MKPEDIQQAYADKRNAQQSQREREAVDHKNRERLVGNDRIQRAIVEATRLSIEHRDGLEPKVTVKNFPKGFATQKDIKALAEAVDELGISDYLNHTEQVSEVTDAIYELIAHLNRLPEKLKNDGFEMLAQKLEALPKPPTTLSVDNLDLLKPYFDGLQESIDKLDIRPQVNVDVPKVKPLDLSPILEALNKEEPEEVEITDFMVQDQVYEGSMQYFGFVHPTGAWMVMENEIESGKYRYSFGSANYEQAWKNHSNLAYGSVTGITNALHG